MAIKKIRRDVLMRLAKAGRLMAVDRYSYSEYSGEQQGLKAPMPVVVLNSYKDFQPGKYNLHEHDFTSKSGSAHVEASGLITLYVHSNSNHTLQILPETKDASKQESQKA